MQSVIVKARAKINLALDIVSARPDGYHDMRMIMQTLRLHDSLLIQKSDKYPFKLVCDHAKLPLDERNLVYRAAWFLIREYRLSQGVFISLRKRIPVAAGLAGGSSDCAATLAGMNRLFALNIPFQQLLEIGRSFGADVPFCLMQGTALAEGIGERLTPLTPHPAAWVLLAHPQVAVSTQMVFKRYDALYGHECDCECEYDRECECDYDCECECVYEHDSPKHNHPARPDVSSLVYALEQQDLQRIAAGFGNVLTEVTAGLHPEIEALINDMRQNGALNAAMTGSGPTVFGYFTDKETAVSAMQVLKQRHPAVHDFFLTTPYNG